jgi:hypothetical protein
MTMARKIVQRICLLVLGLVVFGEIGAIAQQAQYCLLCEGGWCVRRYQWGGACICISGGVCQTVGVCWIDPILGHGCQYHEKEMMEQVRAALKEHPNAHISVNNHCKAGRMAMKKLHDEYVAEGKPITWKVRYN